MHLNTMSSCNGEDMANLRFNGISLGPMINSWQLKAAYTPMHLGDLMLHRGD